MEVDCWSGDWGLPSVHPECLKILAFAKFSGAPLLQRSTNNPFWTPRGDLPVFRHNGPLLTDFQAVSKYLRSCNYSADYNLSPKQIAEANAFTQLIEEKLDPAWKYILWIDTKNHVEFTRVWYGKHLPFPLGLYYPNKYEKEAVKLIESLFAQYGEYDEIGNDTVVETAVYQRAQECLTLLSNRLGDNQYMFGRSPCSVDAVLYAYLAPLLKAPLPNNSLQNYLKNCKNLVQFVVRISNNYFPRVVKAFEEEQARQEKTTTAGNSSTNNSSSSKRNTEEEDEEWPHQGRNKLIGAAVAVTAMAGYAYASGLVDVVRNIEIRIGEETEEEEGEYDAEQDEGEEED